jgi:hypothetical protein
VDEVRAVRIAPIIGAYLAVVNVIVTNNNFNYLFLKIC